MTPEELSAKLKNMYENAPDREATTMIRLFGVVYADEIKRCGASPATIVKKSVPDSYGTEIYRGLGLAKYVELKPEMKSTVVRLAENGGG